MYCLTSVNLLRKYSWVVDVPMSWLLCSTVYLASPSQWLQVNMDLDLQSLFGLLYSPSSYEGNSLSSLKFYVPLSLGMLFKSG